MRTCATHLLLCGMLMHIPFGATAPGQDKKADAQKELLIFKTKTYGLTQATLSTDGKRIAMAHDGDFFDRGEVLVWDVNTGKKLLTISDGNGNKCCYSVAFHPSGKRIASGGTDGVKVWDAETGKALLTLEHSGKVTSVVWSPDGKRIISCSSRVRVWDAETGEQIVDLAENAPEALRLAVSPDGKRIARTGDDKLIKIWDAETGDEVLNLKQPASDIVFSSDSKRLVSLINNYVQVKPRDKYDYSSWNVKVWDVATGKELHSIEGPKREILSAVAFSPDGKWMAAGGGVAYPPGAERVGWKRGQVRVWEVSTGREVAAFTGISHVTSESNLASVAFTPDGSRIVAAAHGGTVHVWEFKMGDAKR